MFADNPKTRSPSVEWNSFNGHLKPIKVVVGTEDVSDNPYVLGYVRDLISKAEICFRGQPRDVMNQILGPGIAWDQAEECEQMRVNNKNQIEIGTCHFTGSKSEYVLLLGAC